MFKATPSKPSRLLSRASIAALVLCSCTTSQIVTGHPPYPKVNLTVGYEVDAKWPKTPKEYHIRYVTSVAVDAKDRVWVLNENTPQVQVYNADGDFLFAWGEGHFKRPHHIHIDREQNVWATDFGFHVIQKFSPEGKLLMVLGTRGEAGNDNKHFDRPTGVATTPKGDVFVTDGYGNDRIVHFDAQGTFIKTWGRLGQGPGEFSQPHAIAIDSKGRIYVAERNNCRIQIFDQSGKSIGQWRNLTNPWGIWITPRDEVLVCGTSPYRWDDRGNLGNPPHDALFFKFDTTGRVLELWSFPLVENEVLKPGAIDWVHAIAADSRGNLYLGDVADDTKSHRIQKFIRLPATK